MTETEPIPGPITDILKRLDQAERDLQVLRAHSIDQATAYERLVPHLKELLVRIERVENKTFSLADRPGQRNCPHCGRKIPNPKIPTCPFCGKAVNF